MFSCTEGKKHRAIVKLHYFATSGQYSPSGGVTWADKATVVWPSCRNQVNVERASVIIAIVIILIFRLIYDYNLIRIKLNDIAKYCLLTLVKNRLALVSPGYSFVCSMSPCWQWLVYCVGHLWQCLRCLIVFVDEKTEVMICNVDVMSSKSGPAQRAMAILLKRWSRTHLKSFFLQGIRRNSARTGVCIVKEQMNTFW